MNGLSSRIRPVSLSYSGSGTIAGFTERRPRDNREMSERQSGARVAREWLKYAAAFAMLFTFGSGNAWGADATISLDFEGSSGSWPYNSNWTCDASSNATNHTAGGSRSAGMSINGSQYITCSLELTNIKQVTLWVNRTTNNTSQPTITIQKSTDGGNNWSDITGASQTFSITKNTWTQKTFNFASYKYNGRVRIKYTNSTTAVKLIDDIVVTYEEASCEKKVNITKGTPETGGSFNLDKTGEQNCCDALTVTVSSIVAPSGKKFSAITQSGIASGVTINQSAKTVTYAANTTGSSTINVTFEDKGCTDHAGTNVTSGAATAHEYGPIDPYYEFSTRQILYTKTDLGLAAGKKGTIKSISFQYAYTSALTGTNSVKIYMANTDLTELSTSKYVTSFTEVYSGAYNCSGNGVYNEIMLDEPFEYDGVGNLVVIIDDNSNKDEGSSPVFNYHTADPAPTYAQLYTRSASTNADPTAVATWTGATETNYRPNTKFCIQEVDMTPATVTLMDNSETITEASAGAGVTLPSRAGCAGYTFAGWTKSWVAPQSSWTTTAPTIIPAGSYTPAADENLYPVYTKTESGSGFSSYTKVTSAQSDWSGKYLISDGTLTATGSKFSSTALEVTTLTPGTTEYTSYEFTITKNGNNSNYFIITPDGTNYVGYSGSSAGLAFTTSTPASNNYLWTCSTSDPMTLNVGTNTRYIGVGTESATSVFKAYSTSGTNTKCYLYKRIEGGSTTYYISVPDCCTQLGSITGNIGTNTPTSVTLTWSAVSGAEKYQVKVPGSSSHNNWTDVNTTSVTVTKSCGTEYTAYFRAIDTNGTHCAEGPESTLPIPAVSWTVTTSGVTNATPNTAWPSTTCSGGFNRTITAAAGYDLPADITVTNATKSWDSSTGALSISSVTGNVSITITPTCVSPSFSDQPDNASYTQGASPEALSVTASAGTGTLGYLWKVSTDGGSSWSNALGTNNTASYSGASLSTTSVGTLKFMCIVTNTSADCSEESEVATITVSAASNFVNGATIFIQAESTSAWTGDGCVKAWFHSSGGSEDAQSTYWLFDATGNDSGKKLFAAVVPATGDLPYLDIQRFAANCSDLWNKNGGCSFAEADGSNTIRSTGKHDDASEGDYIRWNDSGVTMELHGDPSGDAFASKLADVTDQGNGIWSGTYEGYAPANAAGTSQDFKIKTNYNGWIGNKEDGDHQNENATLSGMVVGSTYDVTATLNITTHALVMSKTFVKGTVHFELQGHGSAISDLTNVAAGSKISAPSAPTEAGWTFGGWYKEAGCTNEWNFAEDELTETMTLYAKWTIKSYTLSWSTDGDALTGDYTTGSVEYGATITAPNTPTKTGYTFASWSPTPGATMPAGNTTYTATWTINNYTVKWSVNGDDSYSAGVTSANNNADYNTTISSLPTPPADNTLSACANKFMGWSTKNFTYTSGKDDTDYDDLFTDETPAITANTTFYAVFAEQLGADVNTVVWSEDFSSYDAADVPSGSVTTATGRKVYNNGNVTYYCTDGDGTKPGTTKVASETLAAGTSPELFIGKKGTGGTTGGSFRIVGIPRAGAKELTLTYKQNANQLRSLVSGTSYSGGLDSKVKQEQEVTITCGTDPTFTLTFQATTTDNVRLDDIVIKVKTVNYGNYVTQCNPSQARVDYDANGGHTSCENGSQDKEGFTLCEEEPERTGYDFQGWLSSEDSKVYAAGDKYELDDAVTFTAQWTASTYTINYYDQGGAEYSGTNSGSLVGTHTYDSETVLVAGEKGAAYHFDGWFSNSTCTGSPITTIGATAYTSGPISLYAKWTTMHQITWTVVGGGDPTISYFLPDAELTFPSPAPSAPTGSKVFIGWTSEELTCETDDEPEMVDAGSAVTDDATYYAVFGKSSGGTPIAATEDKNEDFTTSGVESYCGLSNGMKDEGDYILNNSIWNASNMTNVKVRIKVYHVSNKISDVLRISLINSSGEEISGTDLSTTEFGSSSKAAGYSEYVDIIPTTAVTGYKISLKTKNSNGTAVDKVTREVVPIYTRYATDTYCKEFTPVGESTSWSQTSNWGGAIPTADNTVHITKQMTVDVTNAVAKEIIIDQSNDNTGTLIIAANKSLVVAGKITKDNGEPTTAADLKVESSAAGNGTLIFENDGNAATVEMYSIGSTDGWKWQYIGVPFEGANAQATYYGAYLYKWDNGWTAVQKSDKLEMFAGYCISYPAANYKYVMDGALAPTTSQSINVPAGKSMVVGNSWTAPIQIGQLENADFGDLEKSVYFYNTGNDENNSGSQDIHANPTGDAIYAAGTYISVPIHSAPYVGVSVISSLQGFFVKNNTGSETSLSLSYSKHVRPSVGNSVVNGAMHAPKRVADETDRPAVLKMKVSGSQYDDRLILLEREDFTTGYDAGWDGDKMGDVATSPRITTTREDGTADAVAALPDLEGTLINFRAASTDDQYTLYFDYETEDAEPLYLLDLTNNAYTRVETGSSYTFVTTDKADHKRFALTRYRAPQITTGVEEAQGDSGQGKAVKFIENDKLYILRNGVLYDGTGKRAK